MSASTGSSSRILRRVDGVRIADDEVLLDVAALPAVTLGAMPGWLTGEPFADQGVEVTMPNLPQEIALPAVDAQPWTVRLAVHGDRTLRVTVAPEGNRALTEPAGWLSIVTDETTQPVSAEEGAEEGEGEVVIRGAEFTATVTRAPFALRIEDAAGRTVLRTGERLRQVAGFPMAPPAVEQEERLSLNFELAPDESISGFGEFFGPLQRNGQRLVLHADDALGTGTGLVYKPVPVWHSTAGYAAFINTGADVVADVAHTRPSVLSVEVADRALDLFVFVGETPAERLADYTTLTGRSIVPPLWAFGYWMGRCRYHSREEMLEVSARMTEHDVPCDVLHLDPDWLIVDRLNTDFLWNEERFGDRRAFVEALAAEGRRLSVWELPYVDPASPRYAELEENGYLVKNAEGGVAHLEGTPTPDGRPRALVDFTNPDARAWWKEQHRDFLDDGVAVFKTDFGEGFPSRGVAHADVPATHHHNLYPLWYNSATSEAIAELTDRNPLVWGRSGWAGSHRYPGQWGGDAESTVVGMQATLRGGLSYALSAPGFWSHDIGGFFGPELTPGLYVRWTQFGAFSPLMRAHGLRPREPWEYGEDALRISREWIRRRYALLPYLWQSAHASVAAGLPMMRPLHLAFPDDVVARSIDGQFMLGDDLLVVPVFDDAMDAAERTFYLPAGRWRDLYTGEEYDGGGFVTRTVGIDEMPVLVRDGAAIPMIDVPDGTANVEALVAQPWRLELFGAEAPETLLGFDGAPVDARALPTRSRG